MSHSLSEENYLKAIYHLHPKKEASVSTTAIAKQIGAQPSSVTDMLKKLGDKSLLDYQKYRGVRLTEKGQKAALLVIRKHRLWELFMVRHLNFSWDEVHVVAEQLEHIQSKKLVDELDFFLGYPSHDPHGDPIPNRKGFIKSTVKVLLSDLEFETPSICVGVKDSSAAFLKQLDKLNIGLGTCIKIVQREDYDCSLLIQKDDVSCLVSSQIAANIYVKIQ